MCDYSLEMYASRPARASEKYVTTRFPSGSIGLASPGDALRRPGRRLRHRGLHAPATRHHGADRRWAGGDGHGAGTPQHESPTGRLSAHTDFQRQPLSVEPCRSLSTTDP